MINTKILFKKVSLPTLASRRGLDALDSYTVHDSSTTNNNNDNENHNVIENSK